MRFTKLFAVVCAAALLCACGAHSVSSTVENADSSVSAASSQTLASPTPNAEPTWPQDDLSALPEDVRSQFLAARRLYGYFSVSTAVGPGTAVSINEEEYLPANPEIFKDYADFYTQLTACFTDEFVENELLSRELYTALDGVLYAKAADRGTDVTFRYVTAEVVSQSDSAIVFALTAHYYDSYASPEQPETTKVYTYAAEKVAANWQFSQFSLYY